MGEQENTLMAGPSHQLELPETIDREDYQAALDDYSSHFRINAEILLGRVLSVSDKEVIVDIGRKSEGLVPASQFPMVDDKPAVHPGDVIEVMFDRSGPPVEGYILLSYERAHRKQVWERLEKAAAEHTPVKGRVVGKIRGGLTLDIGIPAFLPSSQVEMRPIHNLEGYPGREFDVQILKLNRRRGNAVVSRRAVLEREIEAKRAEALAQIHEGAELTGSIKHVTAYGAFVDLGGIDGLLHVSDLSYGNVVHPSSVVRVGDEVRVKVLKFDPEKERISLGLKQLQPDPWSGIDARYPAGSEVTGRAVSVTDYGAFVELEPGIEGLIHISEMTWSRRMKHPSKVVKVGDQLKAVVLEIKPDERRISLGIKQLEPDPWTTVAERYNVGAVVQGKIRKLTDFGAFIEIEEGVDGLVHISDMSWTARIQRAADFVKKGQVIQAAILSIDPAHRRLSLGMKQLQPDAWQTFFRSHVVGDIVRGRVSRAAAFGVFVELMPGVEGLCHRTEVFSDRDKRRKGNDKGPDGPVLPVKQEFDFKIIKMNEAQKRIGLSLRAVADHEERSRHEDYQRQAAAAGSSVGRVLKQHKLDEKNKG